jgi:LPXTG-motif cell wall-anchored protein
MKKALLSLALAVALVAMIAAPAFANVTLPVNGHSMQQGGQMPEWITVGTDDKTDGIDPAVFATSTGIRLTMAEEPEGLQLIFLGGGNGWSWTQSDANYTFADGALTIRWADNGLNAATLHGDDDGLKILIGTWGVQWADQGVTAVTLLARSGSPGASGKTGDTTMIALALVALTLAAGAAFFVGRKIKA